MNYVNDNDLLMSALQQIAFISQNVVPLENQDLTSKYKNALFIDDSYTLVYEKFYEALYALMEQNNERWMRILSINQKYIKAIYNKYDFFPFMQIEYDEASKWTDIFVFLQKKGYGGEKYDSLYTSADNIVIYPFSQSWLISLDRNRELAAFISNDQKLLDLFEKKIDGKEILVKRNEIATDYLGIPLHVFDQLPISKLTIKS